ncbi:MAG: hypothetical protein JNL62_05635 [Bryobacterales bacterium]|nr:hypothetical protein [Bryobacterales bacterium]
MQPLLTSSQNISHWASGYKKCQWGGTLFSAGVPGKGVETTGEPVTVSFYQLVQAMESLSKRRHETELTRFAQERKWLRQHRQSYAGKWVALEGNELLAVGETAREVFAQVRGRSEPAFVVQIEDEEQPFAGW